MIKPQYVIEKIYELTKGDAIITTEVGQNQMWTAQYYPFHQTENPAHLRRTGNDGLWISCSHGSPGRPFRTSWSLTLQAMGVSR